MLKVVFYTRRLYINTRQDTRDEGRVYSKTNIGNDIETGLDFINKGRSNLDKINRDRTKTAFHRLQDIQTTRFEVRIIRQFTERIQINLICRFYNAVFAVLKHVKWVTFSSKSDTSKVNIELRKHYVRITTSSGAFIGYNGTTLSRVLT